MNKLRTVKSYCPTCGAPREVVDGAHLAEIRKRLGLSLREMALALGVSHSMVDDMEKGRRRVSGKLAERYQSLGYSGEVILMPKKGPPNTPRFRVTGRRSDGVPIVESVEEGR